MVVDDTIGVEATSDGDVVAHAVADAMLGAAALGDIGDRYPSDDPRWRDADSMAMVGDTVRELGEHGWRVSSADVTVIAEKVRVAPHRQGIRDSVAAALGVPPDRISVKATTTDGLGFTGRGEGIAAMVVVVLEDRPA